jgi:hypothetical protein
MDLKSSKKIAQAAVLLLFAIVQGAHAESIYKCRAARAAIAYQDHPCAVAAEETQVEIAKAPSPPPTIATSSRDNAGRADRKSPLHAGSSMASSRNRRSREHEATSYECRAANGEVFYRHSSCPKSIGSQDIARGDVRGKRSSGQGRAAVSAVPLSRAEACRRLAESGGRSGHDRDEQVSTYERNAGHDPCRRS